MPSFLGLDVVVQTTGADEAADKLRDVGRAAKDDAKPGVSSLDDALSQLTSTIIGLVALDKVVGLFEDMVRAGEDAQNAQLKVAGMIRATGDASGITARQVDAMATSLSKTSLFSKPQIEQAAASLMIFRDVQGDVFQRAMQISADLASNRGGSIEDWAFKLGRALEDPEHGMRMLRLAGITFTTDEAKVIKAMEDTGNLAGAMALVLDKAHAASDGMAKQMHSGLTGAMGDVKKSWDELMASFTTGDGIMARMLTGSMSLLSKVLEGWSRILSAPNASQTQAFLAPQVSKILGDVEKESGHSFAPSGALAWMKSKGESDSYRVNILKEEVALEGKILDITQAITAENVKAAKGAAAERAAKAAADAATLAAAYRKEHPLIATYTGPLGQAQAHTGVDATGMQGNQFEGTIVALQRMQDSTMHLADTTSRDLTPSLKQMGQALATLDRTGNATAQNTIDLDAYIAALKQWIATEQDAAKKAAMVQELQTVEKKDKGVDLAQMMKDRTAATLVSMRTQFVDLTKQAWTAVGDAMSAGMESAFKTGNLSKALASFGKSLMAGFGQMFTEHGKALLEYGVIMSGLAPLLANPFTSGPASIAAGVALMALGAAFSAVSQSGAAPGSGSSGTTGALSPTGILAATYLQPAAGSPFAAGNQFPGLVQPIINVVGYNDPSMQRGLVKALQYAVGRGYTVPGLS